MLLLKHKTTPSSHKMKIMTHMKMLNECWA